MTVAYVYRPGHTKLDFDPYDREDWAEYSKVFGEKKVPETAEILRELLRILDARDRGAVVVLMGDHGTWVSRGLMERNYPDDSPLTREDVFIDRHAVAAAIRPEGFCSDQLDGPIGVGRIGRSVVKCLADGRDPLPASYQPRDPRYERHRYE